jgi:anti-sigma-K factor RskA
MEASDKIILAGYVHDKIRLEAADRIETLEAENAELRERVKRWEPPLTTESGSSNIGILDVERAANIHKQPETER